MKKKTLQLMLTAFFTILVSAFGVSSAFALLKVNVMPSGVSSPTNIWDSKPYVWPNNATELWGNVYYDGSGTLTYTWKFGDATADAAGTVTDRNNVYVNHTYAAQGSYVATLTVSDGTVSDTDTVFLDVVPSSSDTAKRLAIQRALKYLYMTRQSSTSNGCSLYYWSTTDTVGDTGLAILAFEDHGHRAGNDHDQDIYAQTVELGMNTVFAWLYTSGSTVTPNSSSDLNGNGRMLYVSGGNMYYQGIHMMAIANSATPDELAVCGIPSQNVTGQTYRSILEDMVDYTAYAQEDRTGCGGFGGWRYSANYCSSDNSVSQWPALGLAAAAGAPWNIIDTNPSYPNYPSWMETLMTTWLNNSQCSSNGGFGYDSACYWVNIAKTGSGLCSMTFAGITGAKINNAVNYIGANWNTTAYDYGNKGDHYAMYAVKKGLQYAQVTSVGGHDWQSEYDQWYVTNKVDAGTSGYYWPGSVRIGAGRTTAAFALLVMAPGLVELPPVANAGINQQVLNNTNVSFDGSASHHTDTTKSIVKYEWDFDYDGTTFNVDATGVAATKVGGYSLAPGVMSTNFTVALKVTDNNVPALTAIDTATVNVTNGNVAPVANPGGPYLCGVGEVINLNGTASYDANACPVGSGPGCLGDSIAAYAWDFDGDGSYDDATGATPPFNCNALGTQTISLKVTDTFNASATQSSQATTVAISDLQPICYVNTINSYNRLTRKWTVGWKLNLKNTGNASAAAVTANLTATTVPAGVTVLDDNLSWSGNIDPNVTLLSSDEFRYTYSRVGLDLTQITFDINFTDSLGTRRVVRSVPQGTGGTCQ